MIKSLGTLKPVWLIAVWTEWVMEHFISTYNENTSALKALETEVLHGRYNIIKKKMVGGYK